MCYVYLSDVLSTEDLDYSCEDSEFRKSKWFIRGWTLQELLAPEIVVFYNHDWAEIGTKASMDDLISSITHIEAPFLTGTNDVKSACVAQKMSWASRRKTTRLEDTAYCLMGLFDVHMPLLYGEGKKAFYRLQLEIIKDSSDESIFAWGRADTNINVVPKLANARFYGLLAGDPWDFQDSGDVVAEHSFRPPYTMTNKGLQIQVNLIGWREWHSKMTTVTTFTDQRSYPRWILSLHCHRRGDDSNHPAIYLVEGDDGLGWTRVSDCLLPSRFSARDNDPGNNIESFPWERQIIIHAAQDAHDRSPFKNDPLGFMLDVRSVMQNGYSVSTRMRDNQPVEFGDAGRSTAQFFPVGFKFCLWLECKKSLDSFRLVLKRQRQNSRKLDFYILLGGEDAKYFYGDKALLPSGNVVKAVLKRKVQSQKIVNVVEIMIESSDGRPVENMSRKVAQIMS